MNILILSKNRAAQLDLLIDSLNKNCFKISHITILYCSTNENFGQGYQKLLEYWNDFTSNYPIFFIEQKEEFKKSFLKCLYAHDSKENTFTIGLTDDCIFYRKKQFTTKDIEDYFDEKTICCSLRLGINTTIQDPATGYKMSPIPDEENNQYFCKWNFRRGPVTQNIYYPVSFDGHIYRTQNLIEITEKTVFNSLSEWESRAVMNVRHNLLPQYNKMFCPKLSHVVNVPANIVQNSLVKGKNPHEISLEELNNEFLKGKRLSVRNTMDGIEVNGSHMYIKLKM